LNQATLQGVTPEQLHKIRNKCLSWQQGTTRAPELDEALSEIEQLLGEVERLRHCCQEITRQYARLCHENAASSRKSSRDTANVAVPGSFIPV
jgi:hypothetical protein